MIGCDTMYSSMLSFECMSQELDHYLSLQCETMLLRLDIALCQVNQEFTWHALIYTPQPYFIFTDCSSRYSACFNGKSI